MVYATRRYNREGAPLNTSSNKPVNPLRRIISLLRVGPRGLVLRFYDQFTRKRRGYPVWELCRVRPFLYVGGQHYAKGWDAMQREGITAIINMRESHLSDLAKGIASDPHLHLATQDNTPVPIDYLHQAADFIAQQRDQDGKVYVHCGVGVGRAPSAAAAYFIKYEDMTAMQALATIRQARPFIHLTGTQRQQLVRFEHELHAQKEPLA